MKHPLPGKKKKLVIPQIIYQECNCDASDSQLRIDKAFDILFEELIRSKELVNN
ncbi:MAG: hypothetical protein JWN37_510 [Candidatus Nomurabacteria bacterium]|nr:hypothetical protein [Candidatus Nomurabacteria bacterium]